MKDRVSLNWALRLVRWYDQVKRDLPWRRSKDPYGIWVSEIMLQQTQVVTVIPYYQRFMERFPDIFALAEANQEEVLELWRGLGYYSRARRLWEGARYVVQMAEGRMPEDYATLLNIPGVGEYTAAAIASIAYEECVPVIDGNVKRVLGRVLRWEDDVEKAKSRHYFLEYLKQVIPLDRPGDFNQGMMELGATVCTPKSPKCEQCPLQEDCQGFALGNPTVFPVKKSKEKIKEAIRPTLVLLHQGRVLLKKRPSQGLLANLWEFPGEEILRESLTAEEKKAFIYQMGMGVSGGFKATEDVSQYELNCTELSSAEGREGNEADARVEFPWYGMYENQVPDRCYDEVVKELLCRNPSIEGPLVHTFSHRRWNVYWVVLDLDNEIVRAQGVRESREDGLCWMEYKELQRIALPVAFQKIWANVCLRLLSSS